MNARKIKTRRENKSKSVQYLKKAEDNHKQMIKSFRADNYNAASTLAIQCAISAADAVCIYEKSIRSVSQDHLDLCELVRSIPLSGAKNKSNALKRIIARKNLVQYESRSIYSKDANEMVKNADRFFRWVVEIIK